MDKSELAYHQPSAQVAEPSASLPELRSAEYDTKAFFNASFTCTICLSSRKGSLCIQLSCLHVFCCACLTEFWSLCISQGEVTKVGCVDRECRKSNRRATKNEVTQIIPRRDLLSRWTMLQEKRALEKDFTVLYCPLCQCSVKKPSDSKDGADSSQKVLRTCTVCTYSFCSSCQNVWDGEHSDCPNAEAVPPQSVTPPPPSHANKRAGPSVKKPATPRHTDGPSNAKVRILNELRAKHLADNQLSTVWIHKHTVSCPRCRVPIMRESGFGCDIMICTWCYQQFCYTCGRRRNATNHTCPKG